jgi:hypothetical protein
MPDEQAPDTTAVRLAEYTVLVNRHGPDSEEARACLDRYRGDPEFVSLAQVARDLKAALAEREDEPEGPAGRTPPDARACLEGMMDADPTLYEKILDTPGFAYWFNELAKLARAASGER